MSAARTSIVLSLLSVLVTACSFANQVVIARAFGASGALDGYIQATSIPLLMAGAIGGVFAYAMVPALARATSDPNERARISGAFFWTFGVVSAVVGLTGWSLSPKIIDTISRGRPPIRFAEAVLIARITWAAVACSIGVGFATAVLNVHGRFVLPVLLLTLPYIGAAAAVLLLASSHGITSLAIGLLIGTACSVILLGVASRHFIDVRGCRSADFVAVHQFSRTVPVALLSVLTFSVYQSIDSFWAPQLGPSNLSILGYCQRLLVALGTIIVAGPSVILQPRLAAASAAGNDALFLRDLGRGIRLTILVCTPVALWVAWLGGPIVRIALERGAFDRAVTLAVARLLPYMLFGMIPMLCTVMLFRALYARADLRGAALLGFLGPVLYFMTSGGLINHGLAGIGSAYALTWCTVAATGVLRVWGRLTPPAEIGRFARDLLLLLATTLLAAALSGEFLRSWQTADPTTVFVKLVFAGTLTTACYAFVAVSVARVHDLRMIAKALMHSFQSA